MAGRADSSAFQDASNQRLSTGGMGVKDAAPRAMHIVSGIDHDALGGERFAGSLNYRLVDSIEMGFPTLFAKNAKRMGHGGSSLAARPHADTSGRGRNQKRQVGVNVLCAILDKGCGVTAGRCGRMRRVVFCIIYPVPRIGSSM